jgi:hypothetical protein
MCISLQILHELAPNMAWKHSGIRNFILRRSSPSSLNMHIFMSNLKKWVFVNIYANAEQNQFQFDLKKLFHPYVAWYSFFMEYIMHVHVIVNALAPTYSGGSMLIYIRLQKSEAAAAVILALYTRYLGGSRRDPLETWHRYAFGPEVVQNVFGCRASSVCA